MDKIEDRLHDTSKNCFECYEVWSKDKKNIDAREKLQEAIHELRRVASRVEIELAVSERDQNARPLAIPPHRDANRGRKSKADGPDGNIFDSNHEVPKKTAPRGRGKPAAKKSSNNG